MIHSKTPKIPPSILEHTQIFLDSGALVNIDPDAPAQGEADVLLGAVPQLGRPQDVLPGHQVQQEQHRPAGQVVLQLQVSGAFFIRMC